MKKILFGLPFLLFNLGVNIAADKDEITEENYRKLDKEIWDEYYEKTELISKAYESLPDKKDSLDAEYNKVSDTASKRNIDAAIKYASVPGGLQRLFMVRLNLPKDTVSKVWDSLPSDMKESPYGKSIRLHLDTEQIEEGSDYYDFTAKTSKGEDFALSQLSGKNILLLYGGLG